VRVDVLKITFGAVQSIAGARIGLDLGDPTPDIQRAGDPDADLCRCERRERELSPHLIVATNGPTRDRHLLRTVPGLDKKVGHPIQRERLTQGRH